MGPLEPSTIVNRCLSGDPRAWEELYAACHPNLMRLISSLVVPRHRNVELVDEIAARVWYELVRDNAKRLRQYDAAKGTPSEFVAGVAKNLFRVYLRSERRRRWRETVAARNRRPTIDCAPAAGAMMREFVPLLSSAERSFLLCEVVQHRAVYPQAPALASTGCKKAVSRPISAAYARQLMRRIRVKLSAYLYSDSTS